MGPSASSNERTAAPKEQKNTKKEKRKDRQSLNEDPFNLRAEELAMEECMRGIDVRRQWSETQLIRSFGGCQIPGTPDGMFEDWDGRLTCVQVVRVPARPEMSFDQLEDLLYTIVLTKIIKSQAWMKATGVLPFEFYIFCWLPPCGFGASGHNCGQAQALVDKLKSEGWPFYLKVMEPSEPGALFPTKFAFHHAGCEHRELLHKRSKRSVSEADLSTFDPSCFTDDVEEEPMEWDIFVIDEDTCSSCDAVDDQMPCISNEQTQIVEENRILIDDAGIG